MRHFESPLTFPVAFKPRRRLATLPRHREHWELSPAVRPFLSDPELGHHLRARHLLGVARERIIVRLFVDEDFLAERLKRVVRKQPGKHAVGAFRQVEEKQAAPAPPAEAALGPFGRAIADDMLLALELDVASALHAEKG